MTKVTSFKTLQMFPWVRKWHFWYVKLLTKQKYH